MKHQFHTSTLVAAAFVAASFGAHAAGPNGPIVLERVVDARQANTPRAEPVIRLVPESTPAITIRPMPWTVKNGASLQDTLTEWAAVSGWVLNWDLPLDEEFILGAGHDFEGDFSTAVKDLFAAMPQKVRLTVDLLSSNRPPLLYVSRDEGSRQ